MNRFPNNSSIKFGFLFLTLLGLLLSCSEKSPHPQTTPEYVAQIKQWHQQRIERLTRPDGWLSLVGLHWLRPGENTFGSDSSNDIIFPPKAPAFLGIFLLQDTTVAASIRPGIEVLHEGQPVQQLTLRHDLQGNPTVLTYGTLRWYIIKRGERFGVRIKDSESPVRKNFKGIEMFPIDARWRVKARFQPYDPPRKIDVPTVLGTIEEDISPGLLEFEIDGKTYRLDPVLEAGSEDWFVIFGDQTNGKETYGAGRFLYVHPPDSNGITYIDFNKAYNPPCVFTPYATCPLPPSQNILPIRVTAGEKMYGEGHH